MITVRNRKPRPSAFLFDPFFMGGHPAQKSEPILKPRIFTNILKSEDGFVIELAAPGFQKDDFNIDVDQNKLKVSFSKDTANEKVKYAKQEFVIGDFTKSFNLPNDIETEKITASYDLGVLKINLVRTPKITKKIAID
ncbi:Hsp20/alpha crystallin family protein [Saprospiraceae bacterium]|nr:Hsp20/alpha crystallin family protein [Saprospiraceae bacterium]